MRKHTQACFKHVFITLITWEITSCSSLSPNHAATKGRMVLHHPSLHTMVSGLSNPDLRLLHSSLIPSWNTWFCLLLKNVFQTCFKHTETCFKHTTTCFKHTTTYQNMSNTLPGCFHLPFVLAIVTTLFIKYWQNSNKFPSIVGVQKVLMRVANCHWVQQQMSEQSEACYSMLEAGCSMLEACLKHACNMCDLLYTG